MVPILLGGRKSLLKGSHVHYSGGLRRHCSLSMLCILSYNSDLWMKRVYLVTYSSIYYTLGRLANAEISDSGGKNLLQTAKNNGLATANASGLYFQRKHAIASASQCLHPLVLNIALFEERGPWLLNLLYTTPPSSSRTTTHKIKHERNQRVSFGKANSPVAPKKCQR